MIQKCSDGVRRIQLEKLLVDDGDGHYFLKLKQFR